MTAGSRQPAQTRQPPIACCFFLIAMALHAALAFAADYAIGEYLGVRKSMAAAVAYGHISVEWLDLLIRMQGSVARRSFGQRTPLPLDRPIPGSFVLGTRDALRFLAASGSVRRAHAPRVLAAPPVASLRIRSPEVRKDKFNELGDRLARCDPSGGPSHAWGVHVGAFVQRWEFAHTDLKIYALTWCPSMASLAELGDYAGRLNAAGDPAWLPEQRLVLDILEFVGRVEALEETHQQDDEWPLTQPAAGSEAAGGSQRTQLVGDPM